jgi:protein TonB
VVKSISVLCWLLLLGATFVAQEARDSTVLISQAKANQNLTNRISPTYPALAKAARIQGDVRLEVFISKTGNVDSVKVVSGHPMLIPSAVEAVKKWQYKPFLVDDQPVAVKTEIEVPFSLGIPEADYKKEQEASNDYFKQEDKCRGQLKAKQ